MNRTSARNFYFGKITGLKKGAVNADVKIFISPGIEFSAIITNESLTKLKLKKGKEVYALFKSSSVILTTDETLRFSTRNTIWGKISSLKKGAINSEVLVDVSSSLRIAP
jgi:molybdate transport system regulatory protein